MRFDIQKADFWKRISAFLFDFIILGMVVVGIAAAMSAILDYDKYYNMVDEAKNEICERYDINLDITEEELAALTDEQRQAYTDADREFANDSRVIVGYQMMSNLALVIVSVSVIISFALLEFAVPIFFGHGRTLGKKIFGLAVVRSNSVKMSGQAHFVRSMVGKCTIEALVPAYLILMILFGALGIVGTVVLILFAILEIFTLCYTKTRSTIHDLISDTVVVDMASQMIFESDEELIAYKTKLHADEAFKKEY